MRGDDTTWITEIRKFFLEQPSISILNNAHEMKTGSFQTKHDDDDARQETLYGIFVYLYIYIYIIIDRYLYIRLPSNINKHYRKSIGYIGIICRAHIRK